jgi:hypothetical protein
MYRVVALTLLLTASTWPVAALADPYGDLQRIATAFNSVSYHADEKFSNGQEVVVDYIPPDRIRVMPKAGGGELMIGRDLWVYNNGKWTKMPSFMAGMITSKMAQYRNTAFQNVDRSSVRDLGWQFIGGRRAHVYSFVTHGTSVTIWVGPGNLPIQQIVKNGKLTTTITYSYSNVVITAP